MYTKSSSTSDLFETTIRNQPEFWKEVVKKDYEILSFRNKTTKVKLIKDTFGNFKANTADLRFDKLILGFDEQTRLEECSTYVEINSIKRLSDSEIFTIGDKFKALTGSKEIEEIQSFEILHGFVRARMYHTQTKGSAVRLIFEDPYIERCKTPLFTTEDGVDIYEGDYVCWIGSIKYGDNKTNDYRTADKDMITDGSILYFSTKEKAEEYIIMNKPVLSINDIKKHLKDYKEYSYVTKFLKDLAQKKVGL